MKIGQELLARVTAFIEDRIPLSELQLWLAGRDQALADTEDPDSKELSDLLWIFIGEWLDCVRDESSVRAELIKVLAQQAARSAGSVPIPAS